MPTFSQDVEVFKCYCRTGRVVDLKREGKTRTVTDEERDAMLSVVRHAISDGLQIPLDADVEITDAVLRRLPEMARARAEKDHLVRPSEHARAARVFSITLLEARKADTRRPVGSPALSPIDAADVPEGFREMYDALDALVRRDLRWRSMRGAYRDCALLFTQHGVLAPEGVEDREQFDRFADRSNLSTKRREHLLSGWRKARAESKRFDLPDLKQTIRRNSAGLSGCEAIPTELRLRPFAEQCAQLAEDLAIQRNEYLERKQIAPSTKATLDGALSWWLAERVQLAVDETPEDAEVDLSFLRHADPKDDFKRDTERVGELLPAPRSSSSASCALDIKRKVNLGCGASSTAQR